MTQSVIYPVSKTLNLEHIKIANGPVKEVVAPVERIYILDESGSMYASMKQLASNLKRIIRSTTFVGDLVTIAWFSDRSGFVCKRFSVENKAHLAEIDKLIEDNVYARGCTSFVPVIKEVHELLKSTPDNYATSLCFMSDGHDNCNSRDAIYKAVEEIAPLVDRSAIIEYGWYADGNTLHAMADRLNATYMFAEKVDDLIGFLEAEINTPVRSVPSVEISSKSPFLLNIEDGRVFKVENGIALIPENIVSVSGVFKAENATVVEKNEAILEQLYAILSVSMLRQDNDLSLEILSTLGDVRLFERFSNAFSKQDYVVVSELASSAVQNKAQRYLHGYKENLVPDVNAVCVLDILRLLSAGENYLNMKDFNYNRIGRKTLKGRDVTIAEIQKIQSEILVTQDNDKLTALFQKLASLADNAEGLQFVDDTKLVPLNSLTFSGSRPNVSILVNINGKVLIPADKARLYNLPLTIESVRFRNLTIIADGIVNVAILPVVLDKETFNALKEKEVLSGEWTEGTQYNIDLSTFPVINRGMVESLSSVDFINSEIETTAIKAHEKVVKYFLKTIREQLGLGDSHRSAGLLSKYSETAVQWLKENGLTDGGFSPRVLSAPTSEEVNSYEVKVKIKDMSSLPKVEDVISAIAKGNTSATKFKFMVDSVREFLPHVEGKTPEELKAYLPSLESDAEILHRTTRRLNTENAIKKFILVVGKSWFSDREDRDAFTTSVDGLNVTVELKDTVIKI